MIMATPEKLTRDDIMNGPLPIRDLLQQSLYYPSCGFDGGVVKDCNTHARALGIRSFIYCDYATGKDAFMEEQNTFNGYHIFADRPVTLKEMSPNGWHPVLPPGIRPGTYTRYRDAWQPFAHWTVYERNEDRTDIHGPLRFSLLYVGGEAVATYQALYWSNGLAPLGLAIIQPGTGFGLNWTDFREPGQALEWVVRQNQAGMPDWIWYGGYGDGYEDFKWTGYVRQDRVIRPYYEDITGKVTIWKKRVDPAEVLNRYFSRLDPGGKSS
jgi:hypothetical protein